MAEDKLVPTNAMGRLDILVLVLILFFSFLYSSKDIVCCFLLGGLSSPSLDEYVLTASLSKALGGSELLSLPLEV